MGLDTTPLQVSFVSASALLAAAIGVFALLRRGHWLVTLLFSSAFLSVAAFQAGTLGLLHSDSVFGGRAWATYLAGVSALASWLWLSLSVVLTRTDPWKEIREAGAYLSLALAGCVAMWAMAGTPWVVRGVTGERGAAFIVLGPMGKVYLLYLVVVMVAVLMNLERLLRNAPARVQHWLRPLFYAFLGGTLTELLVVSAGLLQGGLRMAWLAASSPPLFVAGTVTALGLARRRLSDMSVPVARPVVFYSSVSLLLAGGVVLAVVGLSTVVPALPPPARRAVSVIVLVLLAGGGTWLLLSPQANRRVQRFVERYFYAHRYDYRHEWERVSASIMPTARLNEVCAQIEQLVCAIFGAKRAAIYLREPRAGSGPVAAAPLALVHGPSAMPATIAPGDPLVAELERARRPVLFRESRQDADRASGLAASATALAAIEAEVCAPLQAGDDVVGLLWLSRKARDEEYSFEDAEFLGAVARQLGAALWFARQAEQLAEARQLESLHRLSSFVVHDIKNHVSALSLLVQNARQHMANPDFQRDAVRTLEGMVAGLTALTQHVAGATRPMPLSARPCEIRGLLDEAAASAGLTGAAAAGEGVSFRLVHRGPACATLDRALVLRVLVNLLTNAREALGGPGVIELIAEPEESGGLTLRVRDSGPGMSEEFVRNSLFRPFATTKPAGLGIGLSQCRGIVEMLGGAITVESRPGAGSTFSVRLPALPSETAEIIP